MIQKVNRPAYLSLVGTAKSPDHDPGSSQGSGMTYDGPLSQGKAPEDGSATEQKKTNAEIEKPAPRLGLVSTEKMGMTEVVKDFLEHKKTEEPTTPAHPGLAIRYSTDPAPVKGLLLNRKAE